MARLSENGWPCLEYGDPRIHRWGVPLRGGVLYINLRQGSVGFVLCLAIMLWDKWIEPVYGKVLDDWGHAVRPVRGGTTPSNHYSATAVDLNAMRHPLGRVGTVVKAALWRTLLRTRLAGIVKWGGDYLGRKDEMHNEARPGVPLAAFEKLAKRRLNSKMGQALIALNKSQKAVIYS